MGNIVRGLSSLSRILVAGSGVAAMAVAAPAMLASAPAVAKAAQTASFDREIAQFYRSRGGAPLWFAPTAGNAAPQLIQLLATAQADNLNPRRYNVRALSRAVADARTGRPAAIQRAEALLSQAFVTYARDVRHDPGVGIVYVDKDLKPTPPSASELLAAAARAIAAALCVLALALGSATGSAY